MKEIILTIDSGYFNAGVIISDGLVIVAPQVVEYMIGWTYSRVKQHCYSQEWGVIVHE